MLSSLWWLLVLILFFLESVPLPLVSLSLQKVFQCRQLSTSFMKPFGRSRVSMYLGCACRVRSHKKYNFSCSLLNQEENWSDISRCRPTPVSVVLWVSWHVAGAFIAPVLKQRTSSCGVAVGSDANWVCCVFFWWVTGISRTSHSHVNSWCCLQTAFTK